MSKINFTAFRFKGHFDSKKVKRFEATDTLDQLNIGAVDYTNSQRFKVFETETKGKIIGVRIDEYKPTAKQLKPYVDLVNDTMSMSKSDARDEARRSFIANNSPTTDLVTVFVTGERGIIFSDKKNLVQCCIDTIKDCVEGDIEILEAPEVDSQKVLKAVFDSPIYEVVKDTKLQHEAMEFVAKDAETTLEPTLQCMEEGFAIKALTVTGFAIKALTVTPMNMVGCVFTVDKKLHPKSITLPITLKDGDEYIEASSILCFDLWEDWVDFCGVEVTE